MVQSDDERNLSARFNNLAAIKKKQAAEYQAKEKAERDKNNILLRWRAIRNGAVMEDENTQAELELYASVDDISQLGLDENGHICLLSSLQKGEPDMSQSQEHTTVDPAAQQRKEALAAALSVSHKEDSVHESVESEEESADEEPEAPDEKPEAPDEEPEAPDEEFVVAENVKVLRVEDLGVNEARVYIATRYNPDTHEGAYGLYVEQGYGETRQAFLQGERLHNTTAKNMAFRAVTVALTPYSRIGQPIRKVTIYIDRDLGWHLMKNSWSLVTEAFNLDAEAYCQVFKSCAGRDVTIRFAPAESPSNGQAQANDMVEKLIQTPV